MDRYITWIIAGSFFAALAVIFGAFGAHGLKSKISAEDLVIFETGVRYQMYHSLGLILLGLLGISTSINISQLPGLLFILGINVTLNKIYEYSSYRR